MYRIAIEFADNRSENNLVLPGIPYTDKPDYNTRIYSVTAEQLKHIFPSLALPGEAETTEVLFQITVLEEIRSWTHTKAATIHEDGTPVAYGMSDWNDMTRGSFREMHGSGPLYLALV